MDRLRNRITFGIRDNNNNLVAFTARCAPNVHSRVPKYLNTPRTPLYDKGAVLFGLGEQNQRPRASTIPILVEGPLDALAIDLATGGSSSPLVPLALCGTAITEQHVDLVIAATPSCVLLCFDQDAAGATALLHTYLALAPEVDRVDAVRMCEGEDAATVLAEQSPDALRRRLLDTVAASDMAVNNHLNSWPESKFGAEADLCQLREMARFVARLPRREWARQAARLAELLDFDQVTVTRELVQAATPMLRSPSIQKLPQASLPGRRSNSSREKPK